MKHFKAISGLLTLAMLLGALGACTKQPDPTPPSPEQTTDVGEQEPTRQEYKDLSFETVPAHKSNGEKSYTVKVDGENADCETTLDFSQMDGRYVISPTKIKFSCHDVASCPDCGLVSEDGGAYRFSSDGLDQGSVTVTLAVPLLASTVERMTLTFRTTADAPNSEMRILSAVQTNNAAFINKCGSMGGAAAEYVTVDLGVEDFAKLADSDGYIRSFQMCFRNKNKVDCFVKSVTFVMGAQPLLQVDAVDENCFFREGALAAVANAVAERFKQAGIGGEITVTNKKYAKNSSYRDGHLHYSATAVLADGTKVTASHDLTIPPVSGVWLDATDGQYGSSHDSLGQWQQTFDPSGMLLLTDNIISCAEGVLRMEYAVIGADQAYDDAEVRWLQPQILQMEDGKISALFVNAALDVNGMLKSGSAYRLLLRGVSNNSNYILHVDIPFTYSPLSVKAQDALTAAYQKVGEATLSCDAQTEDKQAALLEQLTALIGDPDIGISVDVYGNGLHSLRFSVSLRYLAQIGEQRLPEYVINGERMTDVYNFEGESFTLDELALRYGEDEGSIVLTHPYDGDAHVILASDAIYKHANAALAQIKNVSYGYTSEEYCTPPTLCLSWTDVNGAANKSYTVRLSQNPDLSGAVEMTVTGTSVEVEQLLVGTTYYWQVSAGDASSLIYTFTTEDGYARFIRMDGVSNVRDIGGYRTLDGKRVKQGMAFRSAHLDGITAEGLAVALDQLGIRTDLDLRGGSSRPLGQSVNHISVGMQWYEHIFDEAHRESVRRAISAFAYEENYPIVFHCTMGRDRTGTTSFLILGLLGVDEDTLHREYYASFFSTAGAFDADEFTLLVQNMGRLSHGLDAYGDRDDTLQQKIEAYLLDIGVTAEEIASIREILLEDAPL